jgi:hypothetical protein
LALKTAVTDRSALIVTVQDAVPEQPPPDEPAKLEPDAGEPVRVTLAPST